VVSSLEMLSGRGKKEYAKEAQAVQDAEDATTSANGAAEEPLVPSSRCDRGRTPGIHLHRRHDDSRAG
jgi:hypothetical protein